MLLRTRTPACIRGGTAAGSCRLLLPVCPCLAQPVCGGAASATEGVRLGAAQGVASLGGRRSKAASGSRQQTYRSLHPLDVSALVQINRPRSKLPCSRTLVIHLQRCGRLLSCSTRYPRALSGGCGCSLRARWSLRKCPRRQRRHKQASLDKHASIEDRVGGPPQEPREARSFGVPYGMKNRGQLFGVYGASHINIINV